MQNGGGVNPQNAIEGTWDIYGRRLKSRSEINAQEDRLLAAAPQDDSEASWRRRENIRIAALNAKGNIITNPNYSVLTDERYPITSFSRRGTEGRRILDEIDEMRRRNRR